MTHAMNLDGGDVSPVGGPGQLTLVSGRTFSLSRRNGEFATSTDGLYFADFRLLTRWSLAIGGRVSEHLSQLNDDPLSAQFIGRARFDGAELLVVRRRYVGRGMREDIELRNLSRDPAWGMVELRVDSDFAHIFDVKSEQLPATAARSVATSSRWLELLGGARRGVRIVSARPARADGEQLAWMVRLESGERWTNCLEAVPIVDGHLVATNFPCGAQVETGAPLRSLASWRSEQAKVTASDPRMVRAVDRALEDLAALRIFDPAHPDRAMVAAGAPWYMTVFGRDSLLTAWMALPFAPELARGVLLTLGDL